MVRLTDRPEMTLDVYRGRKTTQQHTTNLQILLISLHLILSYLLCFSDTQLFDYGHGAQGYEDYGKNAKHKVYS